MSKAVTKKDMFEVIRSVVEESGDYRTKVINEFIDHEIELLNKRSSKEKSLTATQKANVEIKNTIKTVLKELNKPVTISELQTDGRLSCYQNQKLAALVRQIPEVVRTVEKKKAYFSLVSE